jgi:hypothetical protein
MEYSQVEKLRCEKRHRMKGKKRKKRRKNKYEIKTDVFKQECITVVTWDFIA